ncbi:DUF6889 family protein [Desulfosarcina widdelii]|nr:hypothetical protein [Desulfosarcina widdelii]
MAARITTLEEIETHWSLCDLADAHEALDIQSEAERWAVDNRRGKQS